MTDTQDPSHESPLFRISLEAQIEGHTAAIEAVRFSPDGSFLVSCDQETLRIWRRDERQQWHQQSCLTIPACTFSFAPDGRQIVVVNEDDSIEVWTIEGTKQAVLLRREQQGRNAAFSADGSFLVTSDARAHLTFWNASTFQEVFEADCALPGPVAYSWGPMFFTLSPDGRRLALHYPNPQGLVHVWEIDAMRQRLVRVKSLLQAHQKFAVPYYSPDGKFLALVGSEQRCIWLFQADTLRQQGMITQLDKDGELGYLRFSPESQYCASDLLDGRVCIWSTKTQQMVASFAAHPDLWTEQASSIGGFDWSPQGDRMVTGGASFFLGNPLRNDYSLKIWQVQKVSKMF